MNEIWKDVVGYEGLYQVSSLGKIRSIDRIVKIGRSKTDKQIKGVVLKSRPNQGGYMINGLSKDGVHKTLILSRLIATAFIPNPDGLPQVNHIDGDKSNNSVSNLEWTSPRLNTIHAHQNGLVHKSCEKRKGASLTEIQVTEVMKKYFEDKIYMKDIALEYGVSFSVISGILNGRHYIRPLSDNTISSANNLDPSAYAQFKVDALEEFHKRVKENKKLIKIQRKAYCGKCKSDYIASSPNSEPYYFDVRPIRMTTSFVVCICNRCGHSYKTHNPGMKEILERSQTH